MMPKVSEREKAQSFAPKLLDSRLPRSFLSLTESSAASPQARGLMPVTNGMF